ncbi:hypothetical protein C818_00726 [Lachnospiraceae bacterium MD308]|nr:hypothetical protein C818_00726 [Lachnospiraceae bacterium MD308]MCI8503751.1 VaFE repeat-containing surface-anchored protein [Dorea sp.]
MNRRNLIRKVTAVVVLFAMAFNFVPFFVMYETKAASHNITESYVGHYDQYHNGVHQMKYQAKMHKVDGQIAYCVHMEKSSDAGEAKEVSIKKFLPGEELVMACLAQEHIFDIEKYSKAEKYMLTQCMIWYIQRDHIGDGGWRQYVSDIDMSVEEQKAFYSELEKTVKKEAPNYTGHGTAWENIEVPDMQEVAVLLAPTLKTGEFKLKKLPSDAEVIKNNKCYSLAGAQYGIYSDAACTKLVHTMTTDENGNTEFVTLESGKYYVKEIKASKGYKLDEEVYPVTVGFGEKETLTVKEVPGYAPLTLNIKKLDTETGKSLAQGGASLKDAEFTICYYDGLYTKENLPAYDSYQSQAKRKWIVKTVEMKENGVTVYCAELGNDNCKVGGDDYYRSGGKAVLPLGTVSIEETKAPKGYLIEGAVLKNVKTGERIDKGAYVTQITQNGEGAGELAGGNKYEVSDEVIRGDLSLRKIREDSKEAMAGVEFKLTSKTTGESHVFVTDENGEYDTSSSFIKHSHDTNAGKGGSGIWFGKLKDGTSAPVNDADGALPFDTYELEEIKGKNNSGMTMYRDTVVINRNKTVINLNNIENDGIGIHTTARDKDSGTHDCVPGASSTIIDRVSYNNLKKNQKYMLVGSIVDKSTGEPLTDSDGVPIVSQKTFTAGVKDGSTEMEFTFDSSALKDKDVVIFEELYEIENEEEPGILVAEHKDLESADQTISFKEPEKPKEPETPEEPEEPEKPEMVKGVKKEPKNPIPEIKRKPVSVKTGDNNSLMLLMLLLILSCVSIFTCVRIARKD